MIHVKDNLYINSDSYCYIVQEKSLNKNGEEVFNNITFHPTITSAVESVMKEYQRKMVASGNLSLEETFAKLQELNVEFKALLNIINKQENLIEKPKKGPGNI